MRMVSPDESARRLAALTIARSTVDLSTYGYDPVGSLIDQLYVDGFIDDNQLLEIALKRYRANWSQL